MEGLGDFGLLVNKVGQDNVYQNLLASIDRENLSGSSITVAVVHALSKKVFFAKNKRRDKAPTTMLSKKQFAHVLVYICNRNVKLDEVGDTLIRNVWCPPTREAIQLISTCSVAWIEVSWCSICRDTLAVW